MKIGFVGGGNMARALIGGLSAGDRRHEILVHEPDDERARALREAFGVELCGSNADLPEACEAVVLAVKPQLAKSVLQELAAVWTGGESGDPLLVSIAAGIRGEDLDGWLGGDAAIVRVMPNTPALVGRGISALYANVRVKAPQRELAERILGAVGEVVWVDSDEDIDRVTAVSGSGPAYFFYVMEVLARAGETLGLKPETARRLSVVTALGAAELAQRSQASPDELRRQVTSPGGTTERALAVLQAGGLDSLLGRAVKAAYDRAGELADEFGR